MENIRDNIIFVQFFENLKLSIPIGHKAIEDIFNTPYDYPELDPVRDEICRCIMCGMPQSAITLTNHFMELSLKVCLMYKYVNDNNQSLQNPMDCLKKAMKKYDNEVLSNNINTAYSVGLITEEQKDSLHSFRENFRNPYSHATLSNTVGKSTVGVQEHIIDDSTNIEELAKSTFDKSKDVMIEITGLPLIRGIIQHQFSIEDSVPYFREVDEIVRTMLSKLDITERKNNKT